MKSILRLKYLIFLTALSVIAGKKLYGQCPSTGCLNSSGADIYVNSGSTICINASATMSGHIYLNGGVLCNKGTINDLRLSGGRGVVYNSGIIRNNEGIIGNSGNVSIHCLAGSQFSTSLTIFVNSSGDSLFFNVESGGKLHFLNGFATSYRKLSIRNSGNIIAADNLGASNAELLLYNSSTGTVTVGGDLNLTNIGDKVMTNAGTVNISGEVFVDGENPVPVTIDNSGKFTVGDRLACSCILQITNTGLQANAFEVVGDFGLYDEGAFFDNSGDAQFSSFYATYGAAANSGTMEVSGALTIASAFENSNYIQTNNLTVNSNTLANSGLVNVVGTFSNSGAVNMSTGADISVGNYYNLSSGSINGPSSATSFSQFASVLITGTSQNSGYMNGKIKVYDHSLTSTTANIGYGFDVVSTPTRIASGIGYLSTSLGPTSTPSVLVDCAALENYFFMKINKEQYSQCPGSNVYLTPLAYYSPAGLTNTVNASSSSVVSATWQPGNVVAVSYNFQPTVTTVYTVTAKLSNGCLLTATISVPITAITYPTISYSITSYYPTSNITFPVTQTGPAGGTYSSSPPTLSINPTTGLITPTASPFGTYVVFYYFPNLGGCGPYAATYTMHLVNHACTLGVENALTKLCEGEKIAILAYGGVDGYTFTPATGLSCSTCANPTLTAGPSPIVYSLTSTRNGSLCGTYTFSVKFKDDCDKEEIIGCCFSNYGAAVLLNSETTYLNIYCNLVNELGQNSNNTIKKGEFKNQEGYVRVLLYWIHNAKNPLYITSQGVTSLFGYDQKMKGNSNTWFNKLWLNGSGTKSIWINEFANADLDLTSNVLAIQNYIFFMKSLTAPLNLTNGYASVGLNGYFSRSLASLSAQPNQAYLYPLGSPATAQLPFRYRPLVMVNTNSSQQNEISANFMNIPPSLATDGVFVNVSPQVQNVITDQSPSVLQINNAFYHKITTTTVVAAQPSTLTIRSYYLTADGQFQSLAEWEKDPAQPKDWWGTTPGSSGSTTLATGMGINGMLYAQANGTLNFVGRPFTLSRGGFFVNTNAFGNNGNGGNGTIITLTATPSGSSTPTPAGGGLNNPFGTGPNSGNNGNGSPTVFTPNPVAGEYVMTITPPNDCAIPGKVKFAIDQNGNINPTSVEYGLDGVAGYLGQLSEAVYTIDNVNSGITFSASPKDLLKNCVNSVTVATTSGDYVMTGGENIVVSLPAAAYASITYGNFNIYSTGVSPVYTSGALSAGVNTVIPSPSLAVGVYRFEMTVSASTNPAISETIKGQFIVK